MTGMVASFGAGNHEGRPYGTGNHEGCAHLELGKYVQRDFEVAQLLDAVFGVA